MKKIEFNDLPAGSIVLAKQYNLWERFKAWIKREKLPYNDAWIDPFGNSRFLFKNTLWTKHNIFTFIPKKQYGKKEMIRLFEVVLPAMLISQEPTEAILKINLIRPKTFQITTQDPLTPVTLEELLDNNKYYNKKEVK